jgi:hypothetical protein
MNNMQAREIVAACLAGRRRVPRAEIEAAAEVLRQDDPCLRDLAQLFGVSTAGHCGCNHIRTRLAELAGLPLEQAGVEFPALVGHLSICAACKRDFWEIRSPWEPAPIASLPQQAWRFRRRLAAAIRVVFAQAGRLCEAGMAPPSTLLTPVAATADEVGGGFGEAREWRLADEETASEICLLLRAASGGGFLLECAVESPSAIRPRLTIAELPAGRVVVSGPLALFVSEPARLGAGSYLLTIETTGAQPRVWEIPLELETQRDAAP